MPAGKDGPALMCPQFAIVAPLRWRLRRSFAHCDSSRLFPALRAAGYVAVRIPLRSKINDTHEGVSFILAEKEGFEPSNPFTGYTISSRAPSTKLGDFSISLIVDAAAGRRAGARADFAARRFVNTRNYIIQLPKCQYPNF